MQTKEKEEKAHEIEVDSPAAGSPLEIILNEGVERNLPFE